MSKKCCEIIYSDNEEVCKICGESLENAETVEEESLIEDNEQIKLETDKTETKKIETKEESTFVFEDDDYENMASTGHKVFGVISILLMLTVFAMIGLCVYFLIISPFYKKGTSDTPPVYPEISTVTDASISGIREPVPYTEVSTTTDAESYADITDEFSIVDEDAEVATIGDATETVIEEYSDDNVEE